MMDFHTEHQRNLSAADRLDSVVKERERDDLPAPCEEHALHVYTVRHEGDMCDYLPKLLEAEP